MTGSQRRPPIGAANSTNIVMAIAGVALLLLGITLPFARDIHAKGFPWQVLVGGIAAALGGAVLSWTASVAVSKKVVTDELGRQIASVTRSIGQASGQISHIIDRVYKAEIEPVTAFELMYQQARNIQFDVNEIGLIIETAYTSADVEETINAIDVAVKALSGTKVPTELTESLSRVRSSLSLMAARDKAAPVATHETPPSVFKTISCPSCNNDVSVRLPRPGSVQKEIKIVCLSCLTSLAVTIPTYDVRIIGKMRLEDGLPIVKRNGSRPVIKCPKCNAQITAQIAQPEYFYAMCGEDQIISKIKKDDFEDWRQRQER
jgi:hypothetical protein